MPKKTEITFIHEFYPDEQRCLEALRIVLNMKSADEEQQEQPNPSENVA